MKDFSQFSQQEIGELRSLFFSQAHEIMDELQESLLKLETDLDDAETLKTFKRYVHTLKGDAYSVGLPVVGTLCHRMEDILSLPEQKRRSDQETWDLLVRCSDTLDRLLRGTETGSQEEAARDILARIDSFLGGSPEQPHHRPLPPPLTEYQNLEIEDAATRGLLLYDVRVKFHSLCGEKGVAALMIAQRLASAGTIIRSFPDVAGGDIDQADGMEVIFGTALSRKEVESTIEIPGITGGAEVREHRAAAAEAGPGAAESVPGGAAPKFVQHADLLRVDASRVDAIMNLVGELIIGRSMIDRVVRDLEEESISEGAAARLAEVNSYFERVLRELQNGVMKMRMVPVNTVFRKFPRMVRDLSQEKEKQARLDIQGREEELDKSIVDALGEPLSHIIRNMIDHGIEAPDERMAAGKPQAGTITLKAYHQAGHIVIEASDDGRGIDGEKLKRRAVEMGSLTTDEAGRLPETEAWNLMFQSGLSTLDTVTETSGRGVGMDAVRTAVQGMKGTIEVVSTPGRGSSFRLTLPLTLAVINALLFEVGGSLFAIPVTAIAEVLRITPGELTTVDGKTTLVLRDQVISLVRLRELFRTGGTGNERQFALLIGSGSRKMGLLVDRLAGQQELVIKGLDERQTCPGLVSGASILGDGSVVLILDVHAALLKAVQLEKERAASAWA